MTTLTFPQDLRSAENESKPFISITVPKDPANEINTEVEQICLFMPDDVGTSTATSYGDADLGVNKAIQAFSKGKQNITDADLQVAGIALVGLIPGSDQVAGTQALKLNSRMAFNPQKATLFEGVAIREFSLNYVFVPSSPEESNEMLKIENFFRKFSLPKAVGAWSLKFPPLFSVDFMIGDKQNDYYPMYYHSYLETVATVMNPNGRANFPNGAPTSMSLNLTFKEAKQLTRDMMYQEGSLSYNKGENGMRPTYPTNPEADAEYVAAGEGALKTASTPAGEE